MNSHDELKAIRKKELLGILESKKKDLLKHIGDSANKSIDVGKGLLIAGTGVLLLYTIIDRYLESKFIEKNTSNSSTTKSSSNKLLYPIFSMLLQKGASELFNESQKRVVEYLKNKKQIHERLPKGISKK